MKKILLIGFLLANTAFGFGFRFKLLNQSIGLKDFGTYRAWSNGTYAKTCNEYKNPIGTYKYMSATGDGIYKINANGSTLMNVYCDMTNNNGGWTLIASAAQANVSFPTNYNITSLSSAKTINFNNYSTAVFGAAIATSQKMVVLNNSVDGTYSWSSAVGWWLSDVGSKTLRANWSRYTTLANWMVTAIPYSQINSYGLASFNHGSLCNSSSELATYMHQGTDNSGGAHQGVQLSQATCDDGYNWKDNFNWQVYSK